MKSRVESVRELLKRSKIGAFLSLDPVTNRYLSGFSGTNSGILITRKKAFFFTDSRYTEQAAKQVDGAFQQEKCARVPMSEIGTLLKKLGIRSVGLEPARLTHQDVLQFGKLRTGAQIKPVGDWVREMRQVKDEDEIRKLRKAIRVTDKVAREVTSMIRVGAMEREIYHEIVRLNLKHGGEREGFETIVLAGPRTSLPHGQPGQSRVRSGHLTLIDMGCIVDGYHSDLTRTFFLDRIASAGMAKIYDAVAEAQRLAIQAVGPGKLCSEVDAIARKYLEGLGYGSYFGHGLGHGVGLEIHEGPTLSPRSAEVLRSGMVFSVEPGVYIPGKGGVRIEDLVVVTENGAKVLTRAPKPRVVYSAEI